MLKMVNRSEHPLIFFTDYGEIRAGKKVLKNRLLSVKKIYVKAFEFSTFLGEPFCQAPYPFPGVSNLLSVSDIY